MFWNQFISWIQSKRRYIIGLFIFFVLIISARIIVLTINQANIQNPISVKNTPNSAKKVITVNSPRQYQSILVGDTLKLEVGQVYLDPIEVILVSLDSTQPDKPQLQQYPLGPQKFNKGFITINTKDYGVGQYQIQLLQNTQIVGQSPVFALVTEQQQVSIINPVEKQILDKTNKTITWTFTPDIFFVNIYLENDNERFVLAQNIMNTGKLDWNFVDRNGRSIQNGEYVIIIEDNFTKAELDKVRFKVNQ